ncbi:MAG: insulinase family protein [Nannocystaceae bacterium]
MTRHHPARWSRRRLLGALSSMPALACAGRKLERHPPSVPASAQISLPVIHHTQPEGGPSLYLVHDDGLPLVSLAIALRAGYEHAPAEHPGLAGVAASMVLEGMAGGDRSSLLDRYGDLGTTPGTSTDSSLLLLGCTVHRDDAPAVLRLMAENLQQPTMAAPAYARALREHREWSTVARGEPALVTGLGLLAASHGVEPPGSTLGIGTPDTLRGLTREAVGRYLQQHVRLDQAVFLMAGDVDESEAWAWIDRATEGWPAPPSHADGSPDDDSPDPTVPTPTVPTPTVPTPTSEPAPTRSRSVLVPWPALPQAFVAVGGPRAPYGDEHEPAQEVAATLLASTLQYELRTRQRSTYAVQSRVWRTLRGDVRQLWVRVDPQQAGAAVTAVREQLQSLAGDRSFSESIVAEVRTGAELQSMLAFHGPEATLGELARLAATGLPADTPRRRLEWLRDVDAGSVADAIRDDVGHDRVCWCVAGDATALRGAREALPQGEQLTRSPETLLGLSSS